MRVGGLWVGAVVDGDTLVTTTVNDRNISETTQNWIDGQPVVHRTTLDSIDRNHNEAVSEQDLSVRYVDTVVYTFSSYLYDFLDYRFHKPLNIKINQRSYAWSYSYAGDIVFFNVLLENIGDQILTDTYIGLFVDAHIAFSSSPDDSVSSRNDLCGFLTDFESDTRCGSIDTVNTAWAADGDGDPRDGEWVEEPIIDPITQSGYASVRGVIGFRFLSPLLTNLIMSYNWWAGNYNSALDFGPMRAEKYRDFRTGGIGPPNGDRNRYFVLRNAEIDYDMAYTSVAGNDPAWLPAPTQIRDDLADGANHQFLLSLGPVDIPPGTSFPFVFCVVAAENFHVDPNNGNNLPHNPAAWYANVDFSGLVKNAVWAEKIYDNPGVDTDGDGYAGEYRVCNLDSALVDDQWVYTYADTQWYKGDGIPDWRAAGPPVPPDFWLTPVHNGIHVRFNGQVTETSPDIMTQEIDFEGYRIYVGRDSREDSYSLLASYDRPDYDKYVYNAGSGRWELRDNPFTLQQLRCLYGSGGEPCEDSSFEPLFFTRTRMYVHPDYPDSVFYFTKHDYNVSELGVTTPIRKRFPDAIDPRGLPADSLTANIYTEDGYFKYFEYEFEIEHLLPTVAYWVNVTAFDFGSPESGLQPLESSVTLHAKSAFPLHELDAPLSHSDQVYVYPNPYRIDAGYRSSGYEGRGRGDLPNDKVRAVWFAKLPPKCTITIFTLDGDEVRRLEHDMDINDPLHRRHRWDLISRNYQRIVSGLYYWTVEIPGGETQVGKLAVVR